MAAAVAMGLVQDLLGALGQVAQVVRQEKVILVELA